MILGDAKVVIHDHEFALCDGMTLLCGFAMRQQSPQQAMEGKGPTRELELERYVDVLNSPHFIRLFGEFFAFFEFLFDFPLDDLIEFLPH